LNKKRRCGASDVHELAEAGTGAKEMKSNLGVTQFGKRV